ncbi:peptide ABC transporter permease [Microvirga thermotolerans]|uniref:Peptide ABC transporter permease n=1 Tax=Microvirga thermotolerans TaxID=2651334 RepID=A0A5P9JRG0_9HYPH|nr:peptide ABC transporter permease [Microvirga thermotolerans]QFU15247.1 peptide ABC transporter permease [Microvirga thermotolerans]
MARPPSLTADPSADAAAMLRRVGFALLLFAIPVAAVLTRRAVVVLAPLAVVLLVLAALIDGGTRAPGERLRSILASPAGLAGLVLLAWTTLSLIWTPFTAEASERLFNIAGMALLGLAGYLALPDRMRSANLYLLPVGVGLTALLGMLIAVRGDFGFDPDGQSLERGMIVLALLVWPAVAWLHSRGRSLEALLLAVVVALAALVAEEPLPIQCLAVGAVAFAVTAVSTRVGTRVTALAMAGLLLLAPLLPFLLKPLAAAFTGAASPAAASLAVWRNVVRGDPLRLITGHGLETALRGRFFGLLPVDAPYTVLFEIWYELGLVGAAAGAIMLYACAMKSGEQRPILEPGIMATFATAYAFGCFGIGTAQVWWFTALVVVVLIFVAIERGQFRTKRPKAVLHRTR